MTADDLFADIDGDEKKAAAEKEETIKKKKKKKKKNKNKSEDNAFRQETPQPTAPQQDSGVLQPSAEQVSQPQDIPFFIFISTASATARGQSCFFSDAASVSANAKRISEGGHNTVPVQSLQSFVFIPDYEYPG